MIGAVADVSAATRHPTFREAIFFWLKLGFISFGGPTGQIAIMQTELVDRKRWISQSRFLHALNYCMLLPGPEAQQLAIYIGWLLHKTLGGIVAGSLFVIPSIFILLTLSFIYASYGNVPWIAAVFYGLKPAVVAVVLAAVVRIGKRALRKPAMWLIAAAAFVAIFFFGVPFPIIIMTAGIVGLVGGEIAPRQFNAAMDAQEGNDQGGPVIGDRDNGHTRPSLARALRVTVTCLFLWWLPILLVARFLGTSSTIYREGVFFSKAAVVTFGGAYAVLPYVAQHAVDHFAWLHAGQMMDGLGLAETTPGPLIMVLQFVGFMGGWNQPGNLTPLIAATLGALLTTWVTFTPCFLWVFLGAPHIEQLRGRTYLSSALSAITAAVVGVVLNLAIWFALHLFHPQPHTIDWFAVVLSAMALLISLRWKIGVVPVVIGAAITGLIYKAVLG
jgi:chromate transporter